jgi:Winged helix-turn-helix DNA-binding
MNVTDLRITKEELLKAAAVELAQRVMSDSGANGASTRGREDPSEGQGKKKRRKVSKKLVSSRTVPAQQILELIREKGPLRGPEIAEITGLALGAVRVKINELKEQNAVKDVRDVNKGTIIRFAATRGAGVPRKSSAKGSKKKTRRSGKKKSTRKAAVNAEASA